MRKTIDRRSTKTKIMEKVVLVALLCIAAYIVKIRYDAWQAQQPYPVALQGLQQVAEVFPEEISEESLDPEGFPRAGGEGYVFTIRDEAGDPIGEVEVTAVDHDLFKRPLFDLFEIRGTREVEVLGSGESDFSVDDRGFGHTWTDPEDRIFAGKVSSAGVGRLFSDAQIVPGEGFDLVKVQPDRLVLTVPADDDDWEDVRAAASEYLVTTWDSEGGEIVFDLSLTDPLFLSDTEAIVFAHCSHGKSEDEQTETDSALFVRYSKRSLWTVREEASEQSALLAYSEEDIYEIPEYPLPPKSASRVQPYYIMVNRQMNTVTIYEKDEDGFYTVPFKAMICSTGREGHETPTGDFSILSFKAEWCYMVDGSYGQFATGFREGGYLFHSVCYTGKDRATLMTEEYNMLGDFASAGCVRLQVEDAKWIFDNCAVGTGVTVYDGPAAGPLGKPEKVVEEITPETDNGWDPTDPDPNNPWKIQR